MAKNPITISFPRITVPLVVGLGTFANDPLSEDDELPVFDVSTIQEAKNLSLTWCIRKTKKTVFSHPLILNGVSVMYSYGLFRKSAHATVPLCDVYVKQYEKEDAPTQEEMNTINANLTDEAHTKALKVIEATKLNYWRMNDYVGQQKGGSPYIKNLLSLQKWEGNELDTIARILSRWASTHWILESAGIVGVIKTVPVVNYATVNLNFTPEEQKTFEHSPAGTRRNAILFDIAQKIVSEPAFIFYPEPNSLRFLAETAAEIRKNPASFHLSAQYLTGKARANYDDKVCESVLGRLGAFGLVYLWRSSLMKSPHMTREKIENADDFDIMLLNTFAAFKNREVDPDTLTKQLNKIEQNETLHEIKKLFLSSSN